MMNPVQWLGNRLYSEEEEAHDPRATLKRLCTSRHLEDLQWVATIIAPLLMFSFFMLVVSSVMMNAPSTPLGQAFRAPAWAAIVTALAGALNWTYQRASARIGVIDLFACEIGAVCRVCMVVNFAQGSVERVRAEAAAVPGPECRDDDERHFTSAEKYTPVYDGLIGELRPLDAAVVTAVTEFYTFRKTMMDYLRAISDVKNNGRHREERRRLQEQMIYMQFLMYEAARKSITELMDFQPDRAESLVNILCSELPTFAFLCDTFGEDDYRGRRLRLRSDGYDSAVGNLRFQITSMQHRNPENWTRAQVIMPELLSRYEKMKAEVLPQVAAIQR